MQKPFVPGAALVALWSAAAPAWAIVTTHVDIDYSYQRFNNWCASASVEMILSSPAVRDNNGLVDLMLDAPNGPGVPANGIRLQPTFGPSPFGQVVTSNPQAYLYNLAHGTGTVTNNGVTRTYLNPRLPYGTGGDTLSILTALSLLDTPGFQGAGSPEGSHGYTGWNYAPNIAGAALATKSIANSLALTGVAAQAAVGSGSHSVVVNGVTTDVAPSPNTDYKVTGVIVSDPWTGFVDQQVADGFGDPGGGRGFGINAWVPHGYDIIPGAPTQIAVPGVGVVNGRYKKWTSSFNVSPPSPGAVLANPTLGGIWSTPGVMFVTATESQVNGNTVATEVGGAGGNFYGLIGTNILGAAIGNANDALARAVAALNGNAFLGGVFALGGGGDAPGEGDFDLANAVFIPDPNPVLPGDGDWLLPYLPVGGADYSGGLAVDALTGDIDMAIFVPEGSTFTYTSAELFGIFDDINNGIFPDSGFEVPEPGMMGFVVPAGAFVLARRRRQ